MAVYKCKECGANLNVHEGAKVVTCEYCGTAQTLPADPISITMQEVAGTSVLLERAFMFLEDGQWEKANEYCEKALDLDPKNAEAYLGKMMSDLKIRSKAALVTSEEFFGINRNYGKIISCANGSFLTEFKDIIYKKAEHRLATARHENHCKAAIRDLELIPDYKDSKEKKIEALYMEAKFLEESGIIPYIENAIGIYTRLGDFRDSSERIEICRRKIVSLEENYEVKRKDKIYSEAAEHRELNTLVELEKAIELFESIPGWRDSAEQILLCKKQIAAKKDELENSNRLAKESQREAAKMQKAAEHRAKSAKIAKAMILSFFVALVAGAVLFYIFYLAPKEKYDLGVAYAEKGEYTEACREFDYANGFKDADELKKKYQWLQCEIGNGIWYGNYGDEEVKWDILAAEGDKILVASVFVIDTHPFESNLDEATWEESEVRRWLNEEFYSAAFSDEEKANILETEVYNPTGNTVDKIFLLSVDEVEQYITSKSPLPTVLRPLRTKYAEKQGVVAGGKDDRAPWILRSNGGDNTEVAYFSEQGEIKYTGIGKTRYGIRPAFWLDISDFK